ncbi:MAG: Hsp70 family protein [Planctomycetaceae bacterium]
MSHTEGINRRGIVAFNAQRRNCYRAIQVGIDLGATYSAIAMLSCDSGNPRMLPNADGRNITPSVVLLDQNEIVVGPSFERVSMANPESIIDTIKRDMGSTRFHVNYKGGTLTPGGHIRLDY